VRLFVTGSMGVRMMVAWYLSMGLQILQYTGWSSAHMMASGAGDLTVSPAHGPMELPICSSSTASSSQGMQTQSEVYEPTSAAWGRSE